VSISEWMTRTGAYEPKEMTKAQKRKAREAQGISQKELKIAHEHQRQMQEHEQPYWGEKK